MIRSLRPTDLVSVLASSGSFSNYVRTKDCLGWEDASRSLLLPLLRQWVRLRKLHHTLVWIERNQIQGLISIRQRAGRSAWEISLLHLPSDGSRVGFNLLDALGFLGDMPTIPRLFLRLPQDSELIQIAMKSGFTLYAQQRLYEYTGKQAPHVPGDSPVQLSFHALDTPADFRLFQVYGQVFPERVRRWEGMTLDEWEDSREIFPWGRVYLCEKESKEIGWLDLETRGKKACMEIVAPEEDRECLEQVLLWGLEQLSSRTQVFSLAYTFQTRLCQLLEDKGFRLSNEYSLLAKEQVVRIKQPCLAPAGS